MSETRDPSATDPVGLRQSLSLSMLTLYGLGTTIGAGIYVLIGRIAERAGMLAPLSFVLAAALTAFTALSYAEFAVRHPRSGGEAIFVKRAFGRDDLAALVGWMVIVTGVVSSAALAHGFAGYLRSFVPIPEWLAIGSVMAVIGLLAAWGIGQSVAAAALVTVLEIGGLVMLIAIGAGAFADLPERLSEFLPSLAGGSGTGLIGATFLAFFAFIGFGDMGNVAEEGKDGRRTLPAAIMLTLGITTILYILVALVCVLSVPIAALGTSEAPLVLVAATRMPLAGQLLALVGTVAVLNGVLIQVIMSSRVLYGMAREGWIHPRIGRVHPRTRTPLLATGLVSLVVVVLALSFPIDTLAEFTSLLVLLVAVLVNAALAWIKWRGAAPAGPFDLPLFIPIVGFLVSVAFAILIARDLIG